MWLKWIPVFALGAILESTTQIFLKKGALAHNDTGGVAYYLKLFRNRWVIGGVSLYFVEMFIWIVVLTSVPLSIAFPLTGLQKVFIVLFSFFVLKEKITGTEWLGIGFTVAGMAIISV